MASISSQWLDDLDELLEVSAGVLDWNVGERHLGKNCFLVDDRQCFLVVDEGSRGLAVGVGKESFHNIHPVTVLDEAPHQTSAGTGG